MIVTLPRGYFDADATFKKTRVQLADVCAALAVAAGWLGSASETISKASRYLPVPGELLACALSAAGVVWAGIVITSKTDKGEGSACQAYKYNQAARWIAKIGLLVSLGLFIFQTKTAYEELVPLPRIFCGVILDAGTSRPIANARIRIVTAEGVDVTGGELFTDSDGYYVAIMQRRIRRSAQIEIYGRECAVKSLSLGHQYEAPLPPSIARNDLPISPTFRHVISCSNTF